MNANEAADEYRLDRTKISVAKLSDPDDGLEYWLSRPVNERLEGIEFLRRTFYGDAITGQRLQRVIEVAKLEQR